MVEVVERVHRAGEAGSSGLRVPHICPPMGALEAWRVSRLGVIVKVQNYIHASKLVHMTRWVEDAIPSPLYDELHLVNPRKLIVPSWGEQLSVYRNHSTFLLFRHGDQRHIRRRPAMPSHLSAVAS
jgi:hypothetical protein